MRRAAVRSAGEGAFRSATLVGRFARSRAGVSALEFALALPVLLVMLLGGYGYGQVLAVNRRLTITTRALVDLTTHYATLTSTQVSTIMAASTQVMVPYSASTLSVTISEYYVGPLGIASVVWSRANANATALTAGSIVVLPSGVGQINSYVVCAKVAYTYTLPFSVPRVSVPLTDQLYMSPRRSSSIPLSS